MPVMSVAQMGEKNVKGRKRHIAVDTLGNLLDVKVHSAQLSDTKEGRAVCQSVHDRYASVVLGVP